jgi:hypothetical protein
MSSGSVEFVAFWAIAGQCGEANARRVFAREHCPPKGVAPPVGFEEPNSMTCEEVFEKVFEPLMGGNVQRAATLDRDSAAAAARDAAVQATATAEAAKKRKIADLRAQLGALTDGEVVQPSPAPRGGGRAVMSTGEGESSHGGRFMGMTGGNSRSADEPGGFNRREHPSSTGVGVGPAFPGSSAGTGSLPALSEASTSQSAGTGSLPALSDAATLQRLSVAVAALQAATAAGGVQGSSALEIRVCEGFAHLSDFTRQRLRRLPASMVSVNGSVTVTTGDGKIVENGFAKIQEGLFELLAAARFSERVVNSDLFRSLSQDERNVVINPKALNAAILFVMQNLVRVSHSPPALTSLYGLQSFLGTPLLTPDKDGKFHILWLMFSGQFSMGDSPDTFNLWSLFGDLVFDEASETSADFLRRVVMRFQRAFEVFFGEVSDVNELTWRQAMQPFLDRFQTEDAFKWADVDRLLDGFAGALAQWFYLLSSDSNILLGEEGAGSRTAWLPGGARAALRDYLELFVIDANSNDKYLTILKLGQSLPLAKRARTQQVSRQPPLPISVGMGLSATTPIKASPPAAPKSVSDSEAKPCLAQVLTVLQLPSVGRWHCRPGVNGHCEWRHCPLQEIRERKVELLQMMDRFYPDPASKVAVMQALEAL